MLLKRVQLLAGAIFALSMLSLPVSAAIIPIVPGGVVNPVLPGTTYSFQVVKAPGSFSDDFTFVYNATLPSTASAVALKLGSSVNFSSLTLQWDGPGAGILQSLDVLANPNVNLNLLLTEGTGAYVLRLVGTAINAGGLYQGALVTQAGELGETPLPGAVLLFGSVLAGGIGLMRRRRSLVAQA